MTFVQPSLALLLSSDVYGFAVGPAAYSNILLDREGGVGNSPDSTFVGGQIRAQPFRVTGIRFLRDMTIILSGSHSVGQSSWVPTSAGNAHALVFNATVAWHFAY